MAGILFRAHESRAQKVRGMLKVHEQNRRIFVERTIHTCVDSIYADAEETALNSGGKALKFDLESFLNNIGREKITMIMDELKLKGKLTREEKETINQSIIQLLQDNGFSAKPVTHHGTRFLIDVDWCLAE